MEQGTITESIGFNDQPVTAPGSERTRKGYGGEATSPVIQIDAMPIPIGSDKITASPTLELSIDQLRDTEPAMKPGARRTAWDHTITLSSLGSITDTKDLDHSEGVQGNIEPMVQKLPINRAVDDVPSTRNPTSAEKRSVSLCH